MSEQERLPREELASAVEARRELGGEMEPAVIEAFLDRVERGIDARVDQRLERAGRSRDRPDRIDRTAVAIGVGSLGVAIPIMGVASGLDDPASTIAVILAWLTIVVVNVAHAIGRRR